MTPQEENPRKKPYMKRTNRFIIALVVAVVPFLVYLVVSLLVGATD